MVAPPPEQALADIEAIRQLKARYFRFLDTKDWDRFEALFTPDAELDVSDDGAGVVQGASRIRAGIAAALDGARTVHQGTTPEIRVQGDEATGTWAMTDLIDYPDGTRLEGAGHYHERYVRDGGEWRIARLELTRTRRDVT